MTTDLQEEILSFKIRAKSAKKTNNNFYIIRISPMTSQQGDLSWAELLLQGIFLCNMVMDNFCN